MGAPEKLYEMPTANGKLFAETLREGAWEPVKDEGYLAKCLMSYEFDEADWEDRRTRTPVVWGVRAPQEEIDVENDMLRKGGYFRRITRYHTPPQSVLVGSHTDIELLTTLWYKPGKECRSYNICRVRNGPVGNKFSAIDMCHALPEEEGVTSSSGVPRIRIR